MSRRVMSAVYTKTSLINLWHCKNAYSPYCSVNISQGADKENLFNNQELMKLVIICFLLVILMFDSGVICVEKLNASYS